MSSTNRGTERQSRDFYPTPALCADRSVALLDIRHGQRVLEPSAGSGNLVRAVLTHARQRWGDDHGVIVDAVDIDPGHLAGLKRAANGEVHLGNFTRMRRSLGPAEGYDWIIGNPPFGAAAAHVRHAMYMARPGGHVAFILSSAFMHCYERRPLREQLHLWREYGMEERPPFVGEGTDSVEYSLFVWRRAAAPGPWLKRVYSWKKDRQWAGDHASITDRDWTPTTPG